MNVGGILLVDVPKWRWRRVMPFLSHSRSVLHVRLMFVSNEKTQRKKLAFAEHRIHFL